MRGENDAKSMMFYAISMEDRIRHDHPLRPIKLATDAILKQLSPLFDRAYAKIRRPSVPPKVLLRAILLQCLYSVRSERQLVERLDTNLLFRCPRKHSAIWIRQWTCSMPQRLPTTANV